MKKIIFFCLIFALNINLSNAQCSETDETKILLIGDSWAFFMDADKTLNKVLKDWGHSSYKYFTNLTLAENGAKTDDFMDPSKEGEIANQLIAKPSIEFVHLSIGGNDVLGSWKSQTFTQEQTDSLRLKVKNDVISVVDFILDVRPDVKVVWSGYAYPNFDEVISGSLLSSNHPFYSNWEKMEFPENLAINKLLNLFSGDIETHYEDHPRVEFVKATGITQYTEGQIDDLGVAPYGSYPPFSVSLPLGDVEYPSPKTSMRDYGAFKDCFHLSGDGFKDLFGYSTQKYYHKALMDDKYIIADDEVTTASVSSDGNVSNKLFVGEDGGEEFQTIINFETLLNIDSVAAEASIFLHRKGHTGTELVDGNMIVEIKEGAFGVSAAVEVEDFSAASDEEGNPCVFGSNTDGKWVRLDLPAELMEYITVNDITQFKISAPNASGGVVEFSGTDDPEFAPVLNITYGNEELVALEKEELKQNVVIYPNPSSDYIDVSATSANIDFIKVFSIDGREMLNTTSSHIDVSQFPAGTYFIHVNTDKGVSSQKLIKQ